MLIWHTLGHYASELTSLLASTKKDEASVRIFTDLGEVSEALTRDSNSQLILLCEPAVDLVYLAMEFGATPSEALESWIKEASSVLALQRKNRSNTTLFDVGMIKLFPKQFSTFSGIPERRVQRAITNIDSLRKTDPVLFFLAYHSLYASEAAREVLGEIEACALDLANGAEIPSLDSDMLFRSFRDDLQKGRKRQDQLECKQKHMLFQVQIETLKNELSTICCKYRKQQYKITALLNTEQILIEKNAKKGDHLSVKQTISLLEQEISRLNNSRSMRITAPLRWLFKMLGRKKLHDRVPGITN